MAPSLLGRRDATDRLADRVRALNQAVELCRGRVGDEVIIDAEQVGQQVDRRLAFSGAASVVALAGATGSGKSSLFNALAGQDLAETGVRRPTTSSAQAAVWGGDSAGELLDWLQVPRRHGVSRFSDLDGLVLLDLPDHDSTEAAHRMEVDRLVQLVDVAVWVVDPQKYADNALHERYLRPLVPYAEVMLVVLNQIDRLRPDERQACRADLRRLLDETGLRRVEIVAVSATTGEGIAELRERLVGTVADKKAAARRLAADVARSADRLATACGSGPEAGLAPGAGDRLTTAVAAAAGTAVVTDAVRDAWRLRGGLATGWPALAWLARFRPDPLRRLHLDRFRGLTGRRRPEIGGGETTTVGRTSLPPANGVQRAGVETALRELAEQSCTGLPRSWADAIRRAARSHAEQLPDAVDRAVAATDLDLDRHRRWWQLVRIVQWILIAAVVAGLLWLGSAFLLVYLQLPPLPPVTWWGWPAPTVLTVGGVLAGLVLAGLSRIGVAVGARRRQRAARRALRTAIARVTATLVLQPVQQEFERYAAARRALAEAGAP